MLFEILKKILYTIEIFLFSFVYKRYMKIAVDACTLIYLVKAGLLGFLGRLPYEYIIDCEVYNEAVVKGMEERYSDAYLLEYFIKKQKLMKIVELDTLKEINYFVGKGEASTYALSVKENALAVTSDRVAYKKMFKRNAKAIQTDMLFLNAYFSNIVSKKELLDALNRLLNVGGTTPERITFILGWIGEKNEEKQVSLNKARGRRGKNVGRNSQRRKYR
jgi:predicted nucleic acid-binding protein